jgi:hypothetical protein
MLTAFISAARKLWLCSHFSQLSYTNGLLSGASEVQDRDSCGQS